MRLLAVFFMSLIGAKAMAQEKKISKDQLVQIMQAVPKPQNLHVKFKNQSLRPMQQLRGKDKGSTVDGFAKLQAPDRFRWVVQAKEPVEYRFDGKDAYMIRPIDRVVTKFGAKGSQAQEFKNLARMLLHIDALLKEYNVEESLLDEKRQILKLSLVPMSVRDIVAIVVRVDLGAGYLQELFMTQKSGRQSNYTFSDPVFTQIPAKEFGLESMHQKFKMNSYD
jgi:outer membrane lipoprotein-sorting protein